MTTNWAPIAGEFEFEDDGSIIFKGGVIDYEGRTYANVGTLVSNIPFRGGKIAMDVEFSKIPDDPAQQSFNTADIMLFYNPDNQSKITAGLGGGFLYGLKTFVNNEWTTLRVAGSVKNLKAKKKYHVEVIRRGSIINLLVDGVEVIRYLFQSNTPPTQSGIWVQGSSDITITNYSVESKKPSVFVVMEFSSQFNELYSDVIKSVCDPLEFETIRADEIYGPGFIVADIANRLDEASFIIAEITPENPNVYFEVGYAFAIDKPTILIAEKGTELPFDVAPFRTLLYENTIGGKAKLENSLNNHIKEILNPQY